MIEVIVTHKLVRVQTPYHPEFPSIAKALQGSWDRETKRWTFPAALEEDVREMLVDIFGTDSEDFEAVDAVYTLSRQDAAQAQLFALGRQLARRRKFNEAVRLGKEVSVHEGAFPLRAGTPVRTRLGGEGTSLLVKNVPRSIAEKTMAEAPESVKIGF